MELEQIAKALSNPTRLKILYLIASTPDSAVGTYRRYTDTYDDRKHRESVYRGLETLVDCDILTKEYDDEKGLVYQLKHDELRIDLRSLTVGPDAT